MRENLEFGRRHILKKASKRERKLVALAKEIDEPRPEYAEGKMKLKFEHRFSNGVVFKAQENNQGVAKIILEQNNSEILDFGQYLPEGFRFVTPTYFLRHFSGNVINFDIGQWTTELSLGPEEKYVVIGDMRDARAIIPLLHEIGHARQVNMNEEFIEDVSDSKLVRLEKFIGLVQGWNEMLGPGRWLPEEKSASNTALICLRQLGILKNCRK